MMRFINTGVIVLVFLASCSSNEDDTSTGKEKTVSKVAVKEIARNGSYETLSFSGTVEADKVVSLGFAVSGTVESIKVQEGDRVKVGQLLATIEATDYKNSLAISEASLMQSKDAFVRREGLYKKGSLPESDYISTVAQLAQAEASKNVSAKALADTRLKASIPGIISAKNLEVGATASPGVAAFTIVKTDKVYSTLAIPEVEIGKISIGMETEVTIRTLGEKLSGKVSIINPMADKASKAYLVKVELNNENGSLLPGMITSNKIKTGKSIKQLTVPANSIVRDEDNITYIFLLEDNNTVKRQRVSIGGLSKNEVIITKGLKAGDKVVVEGQMSVKDGQTVTTL